MGGNPLPPALHEFRFVCLIVIQSPFGGTLYMLHHTVVRNVMRQTLLGHAKTEVYVFATVEEDLVKASETKKLFTVRKATSGRHRTPLPDLSLEGSMKEILAIMPWNALWRKDHPHMIIAPRTSQFLDVAYDSHIILFIKNP